MIRNTHLQNWKQMAIRYNPSDLLKKLAPAKKLKRLVTGDLTLNRAVLSMFDDVDFLSKGDITTVALKTVKQYKKRFEGTELSKAEVLNNNALLINRVQSAVVYQVAQEIRDEYAGELYKWLPSDAETPDPEHQLKYGKVFQIGEGEMPGDRFGCKCGMEILVKQTKLAL